MMRHIIAFLLLSGPAAAHSWYPLECCSEKDCEMLAAAELQRDDTSWILPNGERIPFEAARKSLDEQFHWCRYVSSPAAPVIKPTGKAPCLFVPEGGV